MKNLGRIFSVMFVFLVLSAVTVTAQTRSSDNQNNVNTDGNLNHYLDDFITSESSDSEALLIAYDEYKKAMDQFGLFNYAEIDESSPTLVEFVNDFDTLVEPSVIDINAQERVLSYRYESDEISLATGKNKIAEMLLYFYEDTLIYAGVTSLDFELDLQDGYDVTIVTDWVNNQASVQHLKDQLPHVIGFSQALYGDQPYYELLTLGTNQGEPIELVLLFDEEAILFSLGFNFENLLGSPQDDMIYAYTYYFSEYANNIGNNN